MNTPIETATEEHEYQLQPWFAAMPKQMFRTLEQRFGWHMLILARPA
jgi:hypothetical protein